MVPMPEVPRVVTDFKAFWDEMAQFYGLGARLTFVVSDVHPSHLIAQSNLVDSLDLATLPEGSALFYIDNTCDSSGTRCHISMRREGDKGQPMLLADCKDVDTTVLHNYLVQSLQAFRDQRAKPRCYAALLDTNLGKNKSSEPFYILSAIGDVDTLVKSSSFPAAGDFSRPRWSPDFDGAMMARLLRESDKDAGRPEKKPCATCPGGKRSTQAGAASPSSGGWSSLSKNAQIGIILGGLGAVVLLAIIGVVIFEVVRRNNSSKPTG